MSRAANVSDGVSIRITVSEQSAALLAKIAAKGIYGRNSSEVAGRFVDKALEAFVETPRFPIESDGPPSSAKRSKPPLES
jgi:hypothetical protein